MRKYIILIVCLVLPLLICLFSEHSKPARVEEYFRYNPQALVDYNIDQMDSTLFYPLNDTL